MLREHPDVPPAVEAFVKASLHRSSIITTLRDWPKTSGQVAAACGLSPAHASRALRELVDRGLVDCLTPELRGRGRLYAVTDSGKNIADSLNRDGRRAPMTPMVRGTHASAWFKALSRGFGLERARTVITDVGLDSVVDSPHILWIPLRQQMSLLEEVERRFGDGSYQLVRDMAGEAVHHFPSVRRYIMRALPPRLLLELAPAAYLMEFNHGRLEVEVSDRAAHLNNYDWLSSPARCAAWHGSYEGLFALRKLEATIQKQKCVLRGDEYCGYFAEWDE